MTFAIDPQLFAWLGVAAALVGIGFMAVWYTISICASLFAGGKALEPNVFVASNAGSSMEPMRNPSR